MVDGWLLRVYSLLFRKRKKNILQKSEISKKEIEQNFLA